MDCDAVEGERASPSAPCNCRGVVVVEPSVEKDDCDALSYCGKSDKVEREGVEMELISNDDDVSVSGFRW